MDEKEFMKKEGGLDLLYELIETEKGFNELRKALRISPNTLSKRLSEAINLELVGFKVDKGKGRARIKYFLTEKGKKTLETLEPIKDEYIRIRREVQRLKQEIDEKKRELNHLITSILSGGV